MAFFTSPVDLRSIFLERTRAEWRKRLWGIMREPTKPQAAFREVLVIIGKIVPSTISLREGPANPKFIPNETNIIARKTAKMS